MHFHSKTLKQFDFYWLVEKTFKVVLAVDQMLSYRNSYTKVQFAKLQQLNCKFEPLSSKDYPI